MKKNITFIVPAFIFIGLLISIKVSASDDLLRNLSINPSSGPVGATVTIKGSDFTKNNTVIIETDNYGIGDAGFGARGNNAYRNIDIEVSSTDGNTLTFQIPEQIFYHDGLNLDHRNTHSQPMIPALYNVAVLTKDEYGGGLKKTASPLKFRVVSATSSSKNTSGIQVKETATNNTQNNSKQEKFATQDIASAKIDDTSKVIETIPTVSVSQNEPLKIKPESGFKKFTNKIGSFFLKLKFW
jgi:hypothetical protein